jgi:hypothetical protein
MICGAIALSAAVVIDVGIEGASGLFGFRPRLVDVFQQSLVVLSAGLSVTFSK